MIVGLDMGGTHIDGVIIKNGEIINKVKRPTDKNDIFNSIWSSLEELLLDYNKKEIRRINLSTTVSTNAIIEGKTSSVGMIIQSGPGLNHNFLAIGDENIFISGYVDHRGKLVKEFNLDEILKAKKLFKKEDMEALGVVTKFSTRNPSHETKIKEILEDDFPVITEGHRVSGKLNFPRRVFTTYLNSAVYSTFMDFSLNIKKSLEREGIDAPLFILKADGGTMNIETAESKPVETILSGPAASFMGMKAMLDTNEDAILLDIGGTTTDIFFLADGIPLFQPSGIEISGHNTLVRAVYSVSIGLGGDSSITIEKDEIRIGPERKGSPVALGGKYPTPTDAMVTLSLIDIGNKDKAVESMENLGKQIRLSGEEVSRKILDTMAQIIKHKVEKLLNEINSQPVYTIEELLHGKIVKPKRINVIGGPANVLAKVLEDKFNLPVYYPKDFHVANAIGAALAKPTIEINILADTERKILSVPEMDIYENIPGNYNLEEAKKRAKLLIKEAAVNMGSKEDVEAEIVEESSFNMIRGYFTSGKNIRVKAQIKPGLIEDLRSGENNES